MFTPHFYSGEPGAHNPLPPADHRRRHRHHRPPQEPQILHQLIEAIGAQPIVHDERFLCCGKACIDPDLPLEMTRTVLRSVKEADVDCMGLICPTCFSSFDTGQLLIARKTGEKMDVPPVYYFQLLGLAQGLTPAEVGLNRHRIKPLSLFEKIGQGVT